MTDQLYWTRFYKQSVTVTQPFLPVKKSASACVPAGCSLLQSSLLSQLLHQKFNEKEGKIQSLNKTWDAFWVVLYSWNTAKTKQKINQQQKEKNEGMQQIKFSNLWAFNHLTTVSHIQQAPRLLTVSPYPLSSSASVCLRVCLKVCPPGHQRRRRGWGGGLFYSLSLSAVPAGPLLLLRCVQSPVVGTYCTLLFRERGLRTAITHRMESVPLNWHSKWQYHRTHTHAHTLTAAQAQMRIEWYLGLPAKVGFVTCLHVTKHVILTVCHVQPTWHPILALF